MRRYANAGRPAARGKFAFSLLISIHAILKEGVDGRLLIAVNTAPESVKAQFSFSGVECQKVFQKRSIKCMNGFIDDFDANEVHVYRIR